MSCRFGEQVSIALLAMCLDRWARQPSTTAGGAESNRQRLDSSKARIIEISDKNMRGDLNDGAIVVVAGFQGMEGEGSVTTLGRGGSDTSAVALAAALKADVCEIYTDVDGVRPPTRISVPMPGRSSEQDLDEEMLELASLGAKVLQIRSVRTLPERFNVDIHVRSSFNDNPGTMSPRRITIWNQCSFQG